MLTKHHVPLMSLLHLIFIVGETFLYNPFKSINIVTDFIVFCKYTCTFIVCVYNFNVQKCHQNLLKSLCGSFWVGLGFNQYQSDLSL